jgi:hypothetical protein
VLCPFQSFVGEGEQRAYAMQLVVPWLDHTLKQDPGAYARFSAALAAQSGAGAHSRYAASCP